MAQEADLKSVGVNNAYEFKSRLRYQLLWFVDHCLNLG